MDRQFKKICHSQTFKEIFESYSKDLRRFIYFKTGDMDAAEDILQDAFVKLWSNCDKVAYDKVKSYLFTVANHLFLNIKKHELVVRKHRAELVNDRTNESPEFLMLEKEYLEKIESAIAALPEKQREVFLMSRIEKKKYKEIAEVLGISVKAVEKRMHFALVEIREKIGNV